MVNETVLVTGSSKGLGESLALIFSKNNYDIILHGRDEENLRQIKEKILTKNVDCEIVKGDIKSYKTIEKLFQVAKKRNISILVNNAGVDYSGSLENTNFRDIEDALEVNLIAPIKLTKKIYPLFSRKKSGIIVNINSVASLNVPELKTIYCSSKKGLEGFTDSLRFEAKKEGIRIIGVYVGGMKTDMYAKTGRDISRCMNPLDVAQIIYDACKKNQSASMDELTINKNIK